MKKILYAAGLVVMLAILNVIIWAIPLEHNVTFFMGYILLHVALIDIAAGIGLILLWNDVKKRFFFMPLSSALDCAAGVLAVAGIVFVACTGIKSSWAAVISVLLILISLMMLIRTAMAMIEAGSVETRVKKKVFYLRNCEVIVRNSIRPEMEYSLKEELESVADAIHYSDPMSHPELASIESEICIRCGELDNPKLNEEEIRAVCSEIKRLLMKRNNQCALLK